MVSAAPERLNTQDLDRIFRTAQRWLSLNRDAINAINVYPVPDGDTGTNMLATLTASLDGASTAIEGDPSVTGYLERLAHAALLGARGNSGVILSQMLRGYAQALRGRTEVDAPAFASALVGAARAAYESVSQPVEGTMLTVMREAAGAAEAAAVLEGSSLASVLEASVAEAEASVERTPTLLPRLREAGVVDAGGMGVAVLLQGLLYGCRNEALPEPLEVAPGEVQLEAVEHEGHGYCTEFVVTGVALDREALTQELAGIGGESILVVGDERAVHVHVHLVDPGPAISAGVRAGPLASIKIDNMQVQHESWVVGHESSGALPEVGVVAVAPGGGIAAAFRQLGVAEIVSGGPNANPSTGELLDAARRAATERVFILPNDPNVVMVAEQARREAPDLITVLPARTVGAGLAAALAFAPGAPPDEADATMREAIDRSHGIEVTRSVRTATVDGIAISEGDAIALLDGKLVAFAENEESALRGAFERLAANGAHVEFVTVYLGAGVDEDATDRACEAIAAVYPEAEVEAVPGGQPHYPYVLAVE